MSTKVLVTGASGFIGRHLVRQLEARGSDVTCLVRKTSKIEPLKKANCRIAYADTIKDPGDVAQAIIGHDVVIHLAASTHAVRPRDLMEMNSTGFKNIVEGCAAHETPPKLVFVSSIAAAGPSRRNLPHQESDPVRPVSYYGRSKALCEEIAYEFAPHVPISVMRPPIVVGGSDPHSFEMFRTINNLGWHFVPSFSTHDFSLIHVDDLVSAMIQVADRGKVLNSDHSSEGIYFVAADEVVTYSELGRLIGRALGRNRTRVLRIPLPALFGVTLTNEIVGRLTSKARFLNLDKCREASAGSWACSNEKIKQEVGFEPGAPLLERLRQTGNWYRQNGWLKTKRGSSSTNSPQQISGAR